MNLTRREFAWAATAAAAKNALARPQQLTGAINFSSSDKRLEEGFAWARRQALAYVFTSGPVGPFYEASLPGRSAFCMRDVSHQATGAHLLGLADWNWNMLRKFAASISDSRDWCGYWEIDKWDRPAPVDYKNDSDFWFNLPANFDVLACCWRQYEWTGNRAYLSDKVFSNFYERTVHDYVRRWDKDGDGIMEGCKAPSHRGIASYNEEIEQPRTGADLLLLQAAAYLAYDRIRNARRAAIQERYSERFEELRDAYQAKWWDPVEHRYYSEQLQDGTYAHRSNQVFPVAGFFPGHTPTEEQLAQAESATGYNVEPASYLPERFYQYGRSATAYRWLLHLIDPQLKRREYPEVSFAVVGAIATGLMGVTPHPGVIETVPRLTPQTEWASLERIPVWNHEISVKHEGLNRTTLANHSADPLAWAATFPGKARSAAVDGKPGRIDHPLEQNQPRQRLMRRDNVAGYSAVFVTVPPRSSRTVEVVV